MDILVQKVVEEVMRRIKNQPKKAVVFFTGAGIGFKQSMDSLVKLQKDGWQLKVILSDEGMKVLNPEYIKKELNQDVIYHSGNIKNQMDFCGSADMLIIGSLTVNTAAKLAVGIADTVLLSIINHEFMAGVPVVGALDACNPDDPTRKKLGLGKSPKKYREMLLNNIQVLQEFGMQLVEADVLYETCIGKVPENREIESIKDETIVEKKESAIKPLLIENREEALLNKKVITRTDILKINGYKTVKIPAESIITEYAKEAIHSFGMQIIRT
jgi:hypothetical protein